MPELSFRWAALVLGLACAVLSGFPPALASGPEGGAAPGRGRFLPFLDARRPGAPLARPPRLLVSVNGGRPVAAVMDTGSTGLVMAARRIPGWEGLASPGPGELAYSSSGRVMKGRWVVAAVTVAGRNGEAVQTEPMPVLAVTRVDCLRRARNCRPEEMPRSVAMLGIGFARQADHQAQSTPDRNPFLRLAAVAAGQARPGYVVTDSGVEAGLGSPDAYAGFTTVPLSRSSAFPDWAPAPACVGIADRTAPACGTLLVDTGVTRMFLTVPPAQLAGALADGDAPPAMAQLRPGTPVEVRFGRAGEASPGYVFRAGDQADPRAPDGVTLVGEGRGPTFVNTSLHALNGFDYMYDAERGLVGFRAHAAGEP